MTTAKPMAPVAIATTLMNMLPGKIMCISGADGDIVACETLGLWHITIVFSDSQGIELFAYHDKPFMEVGPKTVTWDELLNELSKIGVKVRENA